MLRLEEKKHISNLIYQEQKSSRKGFSLIEVLVSLLVLSIGLVSIIFLMTSSIKSFQNSKNQIIASMLAQEAIELMINLKLNNKLIGNGTIVAGCNLDVGPSGAACLNLRIDKDTFLAGYSNGGVYFNNGSDKKLYMDSNKYYTHVSSGNATTKFYRKIDLVVDGSTGSPSNRVITVTSTVIWRNDGTFPAATDCNLGNQCVSVVSVMPDTQ
jgi:prepilin-type N-terminal cleavage/methylation domain-containing protein